MRGFCSKSSGPERQQHGSNHMTATNMSRTHEMLSRRKPSPDTPWAHLVNVAGDGKYANAHGGTVSLPDNEEIGLKIHGRTVSFPLKSGSEGLLLNACVSAPFGRGKKECFDETYRKALKLDGTYFSTEFDIFKTGLLQEIQRILCPDQKGILIAEKDKLNVYTKGGFFKSHKDTPKGNNVIGSLVLVLPSQFEGGDLVVAGPEGGKAAVSSWPDQDR